MPINTKQIIEIIIRPSLEDTGLWSLSAEQLLAGTCAQESGMGTYLVQNGGPALGIYQMEPETHDDCWRNYIWNRPILAEKIRITARLPKIPDNGAMYSPDIMKHNLTYATIMARVKYLRVAQPLPYPVNRTNTENLLNLANYWKKYYNTEQGKGALEQFIENYDKYVKPYYDTNYVQEK